MKVGMNLLLWTAAADESHLPLLENIKEWGFDGVELPMFDAASSPWSTLAKRLDELGLGRTVVTVLPEETSLVSEEAGQRKAAVTALKACVDSSVEVGAEMLCGPIYSPVGQLIGRGPNDDERKRCVEGLAEVATYAKDEGLRLSVEPLNRFETFFLNSQEDSAAIVDAVNVDTFGQLYDTFHANIEEKDIASAISNAGSRINHVHISANDRATPGEDHVDWTTTFASLKGAGYDGWLTIESFGSWLPDLAAATCIWRSMAPSEEHVAREGARFIREGWASA